MFNKYIKIVLSLLIFALSIQQFIDGAVGSTGNGIMLILLSSNQRAFFSSLGQKLCYFEGWCQVQF